MMTIGDVLLSFVGGIGLAVIFTAVFQAGIEVAIWLRKK